MVNHMESMSSEQGVCRKFLNGAFRKLPFYVGHLVCVTIVSLPTVFYVFLPDHPAHLNVTNKTTSTRCLNSSAPTGANLSNVTGFVLTCNSPLIADNDSGLCRPPCFWTTQTPLTQLVFYGIVAAGLWLALISTIVTIITWASITSLRKFPHVVRFHIIICCVLLAFAKMVPVRHGLEKTFCFSEFWEASGQSSFTTVIQGATTQYFTLAHSFWAMCFVGNTYAVIVQEKRTVFRHPVKTHLIQSLFCWLAPALIVAGCLFFAPPGYIFLFADLLGAGPGSMEMAYFAVTLPVQITLGISLCLLWCIVWHLRKARLDSRKRVIRAREERVSMRRVERQFMSMAILILLIVGVVLSIQTIIMYRVGSNIHQAEMYFQCLQGSKDCKSPKYNTILPLISVVAPGFLCLIFFFLLLMNKDCRQIWIGCFGKCSATVAILCQPARKARAETDRSRCSSTLTVLCDRKGSELSAFNVIDSLSKKKGSVFLPVNGGARVGVLRSSTFSLPDQMRHSNIAVPLMFSQSSGILDVNLRSISAPSFFSVEQNRLTTSSTATEAADKTTEDIDKVTGAEIERGRVGDIQPTGRNAGGFIREIDDYSSQL